MWLISRRLNELLSRVTLWDLTQRSKGVEGFSSQRLDSAEEEEEDEEEEAESRSTPGLEFK